MPKGQKRTSDSLVLKLQVFVSHMMWVLIPVEEQKVLLTADPSLHQIMVFSQ